MFSFNIVRNPKHNSKTPKIVFWGKNIEKQNFNFLISLLSSSPVRAGKRDIFSGTKGKWASE
jgi:hypothetical protein